MNAKQIILVDDEEEETIECGGATYSVCKKQIVLSEAETETDEDCASTDEEGDEDAFVIKRKAVDENVPPKHKAQSINVDNEVFAGPVTLAERIVSHRIGGSRRATIQEVDEADSPKEADAAGNQLIVACDAEEEDELAVTEAAEEQRPLAPTECAPSDAVASVGVATENSDAQSEPRVTDAGEKDCIPADVESTDSIAVTDAPESIEDPAVEAGECTPVAVLEEEEESPLVSSPEPAMESTPEESDAPCDAREVADVPQDETQEEPLEEAPQTPEETCVVTAEETPEETSEVTPAVTSEVATEYSPKDSPEDSPEDAVENSPEQDEEPLGEAEAAQDTTDIGAALDSGPDREAEAEAEACDEAVEEAREEVTPSMFEKASQALSEGFAEVAAVHRQRQEFRRGLEEAKESVAKAVTALMKKKERQVEEEEEAKKMREEAERVAQEMATRFIEKFSEEEKRRFERECEEKISAILKKKMAKVELSKAREATLDTFVRSLLSKTRESLSEMKKEAREEAIKALLEAHHERQKEMAERYSLSVVVIQNAMRRYVAAKNLAQLRREKEKEAEKEEERHKVLSVMASAVESIVTKQKEKEKEALRGKQEEVMAKMVESFVTRIAKQKAEEELERQKKKDNDAARKRRESIDAAKARVKALQQQRQEERERKQKQLEEELQTFAEKGGSTLRAASASYVATAAPMQSPVLLSGPKQASTTGVSCSGAQTMSVPADKSSSGMTLREQTQQKLAFLREQRKQRMEAAAKQPGTTTTTEKLKEITEHWSKKVDSITSKRPAAADAASSEKERNLAETKKRLEKIRSERMALQEKLKRTAKCRMSITTPMADVTNSYCTPTKACESDRSASIVWADSTPTNSHALEQGTPEKFFSPGFAPAPSTASILKKSGRAAK